MYFWARSVVLRCPRDTPSKRAAFSSIHAVRQQRVDVAQQVGCFQFRIYQSLQVSRRESRRGQNFLQMRCPVKDRHQLLFCNHCVLSVFHSCVGKERGSGNRAGSPPEPRKSRRTAPLHAPEIRSKLECSEAKLLATKRKVKNAQELRRGIDRDSRRFVRRPRGDGALNEMERNGATQNRRSGSRAGVNHCWGNPAPGRQTELGHPAISPNRHSLVCQCVVAWHPDFARFLALTRQHSGHRRLRFSIRVNCTHMHPPSLDNASSPPSRFRR